MCVRVLIGISGKAFFGIVAALRCALVASHECGKRFAWQCDAHAYADGAIECRRHTFRSREVHIVCKAWNASDARPRKTRRLCRITRECESSRIICVSCCCSPLRVRGIYRNRAPPQDSGPNATESNGYFVKQLSSHSGVFN